MDPMIGFMGDVLHGAAFRDRPTFAEIANRRSHRARRQKTASRRFLPVNHEPAFNIEIVDHDFILH